MLCIILPCFFVRKSSTQLNVYLCRYVCMCVCFKDYQHFINFLDGKNENMKQKLYTLAILQIHVAYTYIYMCFCINVYMYNLP